MIMILTSNGIPYVESHKPAGSTQYHLYPLMGIHSVRQVKNAENRLIADWDERGGWDSYPDNHIQHTWLSIIQSDPHPDGHGRIDIPHQRAYLVFDVVFIWFKPNWFATPHDQQVAIEVLTARWSGYNVYFATGQLPKPNQS